MSHDKAMVRELVERIEGVTGTWFELEIEGRKRTKTLVVEVSFDLDPNSAHFLRAPCDEIEDTVATILREENGDVVSKLRIVNKAQRSTEKHSSENERRPRRAGSEAAPSMNA
jgi:hypothetical protein